MHPHHPHHAARSLVDVLATHVDARGDKLALAFLPDGVEDGPTLSYAELDAQARALGATLQQLTRPGARALLLYPPGLDFVVAFLGCQYAGVTAIPALPPNLSRVQATLGRLQRIVDNAEPAVALTTSELLPKLRAATRQARCFTKLRWQASDGLDPRRASLWRAPDIVAERDLSFLQYTSGSTSAPKGVMVSHANLLANLTMLESISALPGVDLSGRNIVSWLPQFHDMGLIGVVLYGLFTGASTRLMSPMSFLKRPIRWLRAIAARTEVISGGPNFAYDLCLRRIKDAELDELDLSSWVSAFCGSQTVRPQTMARFADRFARCGLRREALLPCYGLAEATLAVTGRRHGAPYRSLSVDPRALERGRARPSEDEQASLGVTSCGVLAPAQELAIVDPTTLARKADDEVGEIWIRGPHIARGYWGDPERSAACFGVQIDGEDRGDCGYLRTGDLGFMRDGELYVTGRLKEIIIVRGRCIYPQDLELALDGLAPRWPELVTNESVAFALPSSGADDGEEGIGLVVRIKRRKNPDFDAIQLIDAIQREVGERFELTFTQVALVRRSLPKTSSGKKMRAACRELMLDEGLDALELELLHRRSMRSSPSPAPTREPDDITPQQQLAEQILDWIAEETQLPRAALGPSQPLTELSLDSLAAVNLLARLEQELDTSLSSELLERARDVNELSAQLLEFAPTTRRTSARDTAA